MTTNIRILSVTELPLRHRLALMRRIVKGKPLGQARAKANASKP